MALCLEWLPESKGIVTGSANHSISLWSPDTLELLCSDTLLHTGYVRAVACSPDGEQVASGGSDMVICIRRVTSSPVLFAPGGKHLVGHSSWVRWIHFTRDNKRLISGSDDQTVMVWDTRTGASMQTLRAHSHTV
ncbi:hypothetical protein GUITHDRAFT_77179, partial [Guillardia theta CCMP2712]